MKGLFAQYQQEMQAMSRAGVRAETMENLGPEIEHLMESKWGQEAPYNYMCPHHYTKDGKGLARSVTGCVATAMAQIMYYHKYPAEIAELPDGYYHPGVRRMYKQFEATKALDWDKILPTYGTEDNVLGTQEQQDAVAKLMRLVGSCLCMEYSPEISTAWDTPVMTSFVNFFNYDAQTIKFVQRMDYGYPDWAKMIYKELSERRPVYYSGGSREGGHAFVVDGYWKEDYFRINWGWYGSGAESAFRLSLCNPNEKTEFSSRQAAIIGIQPGKGGQTMPQLLTGYYRWAGKYIYERASADEDFDLSESIDQYIYNSTNANQTIDYGIIVKDAQERPCRSCCR